MQQQQQQLISKVIQILKTNNRAKTALDRSPKSKAVIVSIICFVEIQSESARALTNIPRATLAKPNFKHLRKVVLKKKISSFSLEVVLWFKPSTSIFSSDGHFVHQSRTILAILV